MEQITKDSDGQNHLFMAFESKAAAEAAFIVAYENGTALRDFVQSHFEDLVFTFLEEFPIDDLMSGYERKRDWLHGRLIDSLMREDNV